jgi:glucose/arabinose dehydrogenase
MRSAKPVLWLVWVAVVLVSAAFPLVAPLRSGADVLVPDGFSSSQWVTGLTRPTAMAFAPDGRLFVCEQGGNLRVVKNGTLVPNPFLHLGVDPNGERGLLGVAFDPNFEQDPYVYVYYTVPGNPAHNRVSRFTANGDVVVPGSELTLLDLDNLSSATNHNGGSIHFGPDGYLYIAVGENANSANSQSMTTLLGKVLRMGKDGSIPPDNPFVDSTNGKNKLIWARGVRNPFTFAFQPGTGRLHINDVGQNTWEEIDLGQAGANYGWPNNEGPAGPNNPNFTRPIFSYRHDDPVLGGCAITGGTFYNPSVARFPAEYVGKYFFSDFCGGYIAYINPQNPSSATVFDTALISPVDLQVGPDGALYCLSHADDPGASLVTRIDYTVNSPPLITGEPQDLTVSEGAPATFTVSAVGAATLTYQWQRNDVDIPDATGPSYTLPSPTLDDTGAQFRVKVHNGLGDVTSREATLTVTANTPPVATILTPTEGAHYVGGQAVSYSGNATDAEDASLPASAFTWRIDFHHDEHTHPFLPETSGSKTGNFTIPTEGETSANVWYRIHLTVKDSSGATASTFRDILPTKSTFTLQTSPTGLGLTLDGQPVTTPVSIEGVVGIKRTIGAPTTQSPNGDGFTLEGWSDGGSATHDISTPSTNTTYTATYGLTDGAPTNLVAQARSAIRADVGWDESSNSETGFIVERKTGNGEWSNIGQTGPNQTAYTDTTLSPQTQYSYRVRAVISGLDTVPSNEFVITTPAVGKLHLTPTGLTFGRVRVGHSKTLTVIARNNGKGPLPVTVGGLPAPFSITNGGSFTLLKNKQRKFSVTFTPTKTGQANSKLTIQSDDPNHRNVSFTVSGRGF